MLYADDGQRHILMDPRAATATHFPADVLDTIRRSQLAHVTIADIGRPVLEAAAAARVPVAVDLQAVTEIDNERVRTFAGAASVLFLSGARLPSGERLDTLRAIAARFDVPIAVMGLGSDGAAMTTDAGASVITAPCHSPRPVRSTLGAGDALAAGFPGRPGAGNGPRTMPAPRHCVRRPQGRRGGRHRGISDAAELSRLEAGWPGADDRRCAGGRVPESVSHRLPRAARTPVGCRSGPVRQTRREHPGFEPVVAIMVPPPDTRIGILRVPAPWGMAPAAARDPLRRVEKPINHQDFPEMVATVLCGAVLPVPRPRRVQWSGLPGGRQRR